VTSEERLRPRPTATLTVHLLAAAMLFGLCFTARADSGGDPPTRVQAPADGVDVSRGDEWIYEIRDSLTGDPLSVESVVVVEKHANTIDARLRITASRTGIERVGAATFDLFWRRLPDEISPGNGAQESWGVKPKLRIGEDWDYSFERPLMGSTIMMRWIGHGEALAAESVELPNGRTVQALKVEFFERPSVARYHFEMHVVEWFSLEINRYVQRDVEMRLDNKITDSTTELLQDYIRRQ
jgi:hypothetical protein